MKTCSRRLDMALSIIFLSVLLVHSNACSQDMLKGAIKLKFESKEIDTLLNFLSRGNLAEVPRYLFKDTYDDELPDLVIFVDGRRKTVPRGSPVRIDLVKDDKTREELFGERFIYVLAFVAEDHSTTYPLANSGTNPVVRMASLDRRVESGEFAFFTAVKMIAAAFLGQTVESKIRAKCPPDTQVNLVLELYGEATDSTSRLYHGRAKLPLAENTINRIRVENIDSRVQPLVTFGNYSGSWVTSSISLIGTFLHSQTAAEENVDGASVEPFIFGHLYIKRPQRPKPRLNRSGKEFWRQTSFSLATGTRLSEDIFDDVFVGLSAGHLISTLGIVAGYNFRTSRWSDVERKTIKGHFAVGITFIL